MFTREVQQRLDEIGILWNNVEGHLKQAERVRLEVIISAVNELRYAGRLAVDALATAGDADLSNEAKVAKLDHIIAEIKNNCTRAHADVTDALVLHYHKRLAANVEDFSLSIVMTHFPQYGQMVAEIKTINEFMAESRKDRHQRLEMYERIDRDHLPRLANLFEAMDAVADDLISEVNRRNRNEWWSSFFGKWGFWAAIAALLIAVYLGFAPAYHLWPFMNG